MYSTECPFCGMDHDVVDNDVLEDLRVFVCPNIPPGFLYINTEYDDGPSGKLVAVGA